MGREDACFAAIWAPLAKHQELRSEIRAAQPVQRCGAAGPMGGHKWSVRGQISRGRLSVHPVLDGICVWLLRVVPSDDANGSLVYKSEVISRTLDAHGASQKMCVVPR